MLPRNEPAKSTSMWSHGSSGSGDKLAAGAGAVTAQTVHTLQQVSTLVSMFGHHTYSRAIVFMRTIPRWDWCSMVITLLWSSCWTITRQSHSRTPFTSQISICALKCGFRAPVLHSGPEVGQPLHAKFSDITESFDVIGNLLITSVAICRTSDVIARLPPRGEMRIWTGWKSRKSTCVAVFCWTAVEDAIVVSHQQQSPAL